MMRKTIPAKKLWSILLVLTMLAALTGCAQSSTTLTDAAAVLQDIGTTQYFTDEAVSLADMEAIVQAGINAPSAMNGQPWHFSVITDKTVLEQISGGMGGGMPFGATPPGNGNEDMPAPGGMTPPEGMEFPKDMEQPEGMDFPEGMEMPEGMAPPAGPQGFDGSTSKAGITDAPLVIVISCAAGSQLDAGLACQNMSATAQLLGYGTKILTSPTMALNGGAQDTYRELLGIPEGYSAAAVLLIGREDTSVDTTADGYTGATARNSEEQMVTYITGT